MPRCLITAGRIRAVIDGAETWPEIVDALRRHRVRYTYSTEGGDLHIRVPARTGTVRIIPTAADSIRPRLDRFRFPVLHPDR